MSRRFAIIIAVLAIIVFAVVYFWPEKTAAGSVSGRLHLGASGFSIGGAVGDVRFSTGRGHRQLARPGRHRDGWGSHRHRPGSVSGRLHRGDAGTTIDLGAVRFSDGKERRHSDSRDRHRDGWGLKRDRWHDRRRGLRPVVVVPPYSTERVIVYDTVIAPPPPAPQVPASPEAPPPPLDPEGGARTLSAPGAAPPREWVLGAVLPPDLPHVGLDAAAYGLPPPPDGQIYARVDGDVLRIDAGTRRIISVLAQ